MTGERVGHHRVTQPCGVPRPLPSWYPVEHLLEHAIAVERLGDAVSDHETSIARVQLQRLAFESGVVEETSGRSTPAQKAQAASPFHHRRRMRSDPSAIAAGIPLPETSATRTTHTDGPIGTKS